MHAFRRGVRRGRLLRAIGVWQQLNLMLTRYNAACAVGAFSALSAYGSNLTVMHAL